MDRRERIFEYLQKSGCWDLDLIADTKKAVENFVEAKGHFWVEMKDEPVIDYIEELETLVFHCIENHGDE